jgi:hypothetical protein
MDLEKKWIWKIYMNQCQQIIIDMYMKRLIKKYFIFMNQYKDMMKRFDYDFKTDQYWSMLNLECKYGRSIIRIRKDQVRYGFLANEVYLYKTYLEEVSDMKILFKLDIELNKLYNIEKQLICEMVYYKIHHNSKCQKPTFI